MLYYIEQDSNTFNQYNEVMSVALVTNEQVIKALRNYNPWWRNPSAAKEEDRPQHRVAYHETLRIIVPFEGLNLIALSKRFIQICIKSPSFAVYLTSSNST